MLNICSISIGDFVIDDESKLGEGWLFMHIEICCKSANYFKNSAG